VPWATFRDKRKNKEIAVCLIVMGQQAFGKDALAKFLETGTDEIVAVYCEPDRDGETVHPIKELALENNLPVFQLPNFKEQEALDGLDP